MARQVKFLLCLYDFMDLTIKTEKYHKTFKNYTQSLIILIPMFNNNNIDIKPLSLLVY